MMRNLKRPIDHSQKIEIKELRFEAAQFTFRGSNKALFENLNLELPVGKNVWITGAAGAGQSTFLKLISLVAPLSNGSFFINQEDTSQMTFEEFLPYRLKIGYTFDFGGLFSNRTLLENLVLPLVYHKICDQEQAEVQVRELANRFRFMGQLSNRPATVSGGMRKLVCILRATLLAPEMLVMDDPFTALDLASAKALLDLIRESRDRGTLKHVFLTSREENWIEKLDPELLVIEHGYVSHYNNEIFGQSSSRASSQSSSQSSSQVASRASSQTQKKQTGDAA